MLVAVFMLFVIGAMAALSIDVVTLYTARSEAQLAADAAALAAARVLANSGATSDTVGASMGVAQARASAVATQVAEQNQVGGAYLTALNITAISFGGTLIPANPTVTVTVQKADLPTFFARIWGRTTIAVSASATAEVYNPSPSPLGAPTNPPLPVAPICVKPWLLPNISPNPGPVNPRIFDPAAGTILDTNLLGWETPNGPGNKLRTDCTPTTCSANSAPTAWRYYPGTTDPAGDFPAPSASSCTGCGAFNNFQLSIAGCVQTPISCSSPAANPVHIDQTPDGGRDAEAAQAVDSLTHSVGNGGDSVDTATGTNPPFQFLAGTENPVVLSGSLAAGADVMVSDSLVTVPVINVDTGTTVPLPGFPNVYIIGFVQLFLSPTGQPVPGSNHIHTQVINLVGCGTALAGQPILGNGASPVAVRLISP